jgi:hypothetical protein
MSSIHLLSQLLITSFTSYYNYNYYLFNACTKSFKIPISIYPLNRKHSQHTSDTHMTSYVNQVTLACNRLNVYIAVNPTKSKQPPVQSTLALLQRNFMLMKLMKYVPQCRDRSQKKAKFLSHSQQLAVLVMSL